MKHYGSLAFEITILAILIIIVGLLLPEDKSDLPLFLLWIFGAIGSALRNFGD